jgi:S-(hydroxymethyl)glutathione dehydrogenase/alcohol dehydrogenase
MLKTQAAVVYAHNEPVVVEELTLDAPKAGEVLLRMAASGVCHSDLSVVNGTIYYDPPVVLGHEGAGIVEAVGDGVTKVKEGDHVVLSFVSYCGKCKMCQSGRVCLCRGFTTPRGYLIDGTPRLHNAKGEAIQQMARIGTMSQRAVVPQESVIPIAAHYPLDRAALVGCGVTTGVGAVLNTAQVEPGSTVAVIGAGGVGLNVIQGAALAQASHIIAIDIVPEKLEFARRFGATDLVNAKEGDAVAAVLAMTDGFGSDYAFEAIGNAATITQAYQMVRPAGTAVIVGLTRMDTHVPIPTGDMVRSEKQLIGSFYGSSRPHEDMPRLLGLYEEGKLKLDELITTTYRLDQINQAFADMEAGINARGVILFEH